MSSGSTSASKKASVKKPVTLESAQAKRNSAMKKSPLAYWTFDRAGNLSLGGAVAHANKKHSLGRTNEMARFVYYPDLRVAGTLGQIVELLTTDVVDGGRRVQKANPTLYVGAKEALLRGQPQGQSSIQALTTPLQIYQASFDPFDAKDAAFIATLKPKAVKEVVEPVGKWLAIGEALTSASKATKSGKGKSKKGGSSDSQSSNIGTRIHDFNVAMADLLAGRPVEKVFNVTKFNKDTGTSAGREDAPKSDRSHAIWPEVVIGGVPRRVPIVVQPHSLQNLRDYVNSVVRASQYAQVADEILRSAEAINAGRNSLGGAAAPSTLGGMSLGLAQPAAAPAPMAALPMQSFAGPLSMLPQQPTLLPQSTVVPRMAGSLTPRSGAGNLSPGPMMTAQMLPPIGTQASPLRGLGLGGLQQ